MKIAYGTYAMPGVPQDDAVRAMADVGYEGVEFILLPHHESMPDQWSAALRSDIRALLGDLGMGIPSLFLARPILTDDETTHAATLGLLGETLTLARDLGMGPTPVLSTDLGGRSVDWPDGKTRLLDTVAAYAEFAAREDFTLALEPHYGGLLDRTERVLWLMDALGDNPRVRLLFDISHFQLAGDDVLATVAALAPYAAHVHIKEGRQLDDGFEFLVTGAGELDLPTYLAGMAAAGWDGYVTLEVARMIWSRQDYDALLTARASFRAVMDGMAAAGVPRG